MTVKGERRIGRRRPRLGVYVGEPQGYGQLRPGMIGYVHWDTGARAWAFRQEYHQGFAYAVERNEIVMV